MGIGGEYAAINSAIDELIPARYRGRVDIAVNGTYWGGALLASVLFLLVVKHLPGAYSWRIAFLFGPALGFVILFVRRNLPESPDGCSCTAGSRKPRKQSRRSSDTSRKRVARWTP
jgi:MFS family permease